ncbi:protein phosphatase 2C domain-containing protein [Dasania sp. GY-MA-18]|uniref:Protein phosphatase 2C domain-containing protein n=1 Tax=Dasania phycosphaerae TaxID=2950436 RepID=A0A9J6RNW8_9GAMM|nr:MULTISPECIES: protein phosphatase 2C domain-containing protein [Dasania]MCR8923269.1 protein phosphatase 2C domain-containing protein [Dasania sp. GY-MA-18]MCZ0865701.1 protein phosphatase 2C domain-containing protein [Dasania phycosphaerae]MCZ0869426.1 protein phosphatase 2C domain-containing protein [Dasania phycosphaerae]
MIQFFGDTHKGNRKHNEDCVAADNELGLGLVADGMGGYACGEVASALVRETLVDALIHHQGLSEAIVRAHYLIRSESTNDPDKKGMGSTVVAAKSQGNSYEIAWVGDSRAYIWDGQLKQITRDHSYVESLLASGSISLAEAKTHPNRNLITQAVGAAGEEGLEVSVVNGQLAAGQMLLLCSDGLVDEVSDAEIATLLNESAEGPVLVDMLIQAAVAAGGRDNISVVIAQADSVMVDDDVAREPFVVCTTGLDGVSERHPLPAALSTSAYKGAAITTDSETLEIVDNSAGLRANYFCFAIGLAVLVCAVLLWKGV